MKKICVESTRRLSICAANTVSHFCKTAARLSGKLALREQLREEKCEGYCSSMAMAEVDEKQLRKTILSTAKDCQHTLYRMNELAKSHGIKSPLYMVEDMSLSEVIESVNAYVYELVGESDYHDWVDDDD